MFSTASNTSEQPTYSFESEENASKWKGLLVAALQKVHYQVNTTLTAREDAVDYVEQLILQLLAMLCAAQPKGVDDVKERVTKTFPHPIEDWAIRDAQSAIEKGKKKSSLVLPVDKIHPLLQKEILGYKIEYQVSQYIVAVLEYISADILKLAGNYVRNIRHGEVTCQDIKVAMCADKVLMDMFYRDEDVPFGIEDDTSTRTSVTYDEVVKDLIHEEKQYIRDLHMIIKVFREPFAKLLPIHKDLDLIFSNIMDIYDFAVTFLGSLEDTIEMTEENQTPAIGSCFEELAEAAEFDVYYNYAREILHPEWRNKLMALFQRPDVSHTLQTAGHGFKSAVKYVLPKLLLGPIYHCFLYFDYNEVLSKLSPLEEDRENLKEAAGPLQLLKMKLENTCKDHLPKKKPGETTLRIHGRMSRQAALQKMNELQRSIDGWEGKDIGQCCNEFILEGVLGKLGSGKRLTERHVFLFDGMMISCKQNNRRSSVTGSIAEFRLKEKYFIRKIEISDREDTEELKNAFEITSRDQANVVMYARTVEDKCNWMSALIMLSTRSMLERTLDSILSEEEKKHPLRFPPPDLYRFAVEDDETTIVFEERESPGGVPIIKGATLLKLVERLTYHMYADPMFVRTFLTTYHSFCQPHELLDLLTERFNIPEPPVPTNSEGDSTCQEREILKITLRDDLKRFRKEYSQPVQFRVLNVLRHWVDHHFYDFERDPSLLGKLQRFLDSVKGKSMKKWVESITKIIQRRLDSAEEQREITFGFERTPPTIEWYLARTLDQFDLMTLHPVELARQLTLLEFDLYRTVKPSELMGAAWTKKNKEKTSPNVLKMSHHSNSITRWLEKWVVESENFEERCAVVSRILEVMIVLQELNNFTGVVEVVSAMNSAPVYRLEHTFQNINNKLTKALDDAKDLNSDHYKKLQEKLRSINPPCVPFLGMYLTNILHTDEGNSDFLHNYPEGTINFSKRRKVAEIIGEIQQYQNQPYCLSQQPDIRCFFENLNPQDGLTEKQFDDYIYDKSLEIEPRNCKQPPKFPRKWPDSYLKSPGIKPRQSRPQPLTSVESNLLRGSSTRVHEDRDLHSPRVTTPPTPSTPLTPPANANSDNCVFAPVLIQGGNTSPGPLSTHSMMLPPPLPPRPKRDSILKASDAPVLPPRDSTPPPLPPRRDTGTLPRARSGSLMRNSSINSIDSLSSSVTAGLPRRPSTTEANAPPLAPRRNSQSQASTSNGPLLSPSLSTVSSNPQLPPKTYKVNMNLNHHSASSLPR